jgi:hypothetical protein
MVSLDGVFVHVLALGKLSCVPFMLFEELLYLAMVRRPSILGEKVGAFFGGRGGCLFIDDELGVDES